jgi:hypothetical protein
MRLPGALADRRAVSRPPGKIGIGLEEHVTDHREFQVELAAYTAERLKGESARRLDDHLEECDECREMVSSLKEFGRTLVEEGEALFDGHPSPAALGDFARGISDEGREAIVRHLENCAPCGLEVEAWRRVTARRRPSIGRMAWPLAAGVLVGVALGAFASTMLLPERERVPPVQPSAATVGPMLVLPRLVRGSGETIPYAAHRDSGFVAVACPAQVPEDASPDRGFVYVLQDADGGDQPVWSQAMSARAIREHLAGPAASVILLVPAASLHPGRYEFTLSPDGSNEQPIYRVDVEMTEAR